MPGPGMGGAAGEIEAGHVAATIAGLERADEAAVAREAVDRAVQHAVAVVDVLRRQVMLDDDPRSSRSVMPAQRASLSKMTSR